MADSDEAWAIAGSLGATSKSSSTSVLPSSASRLSTGQILARRESPRRPCTGTWGRSGPRRRTIRGSFHPWRSSEPLRNASTIGSSPRSTSSPSAGGIPRSRARRHSWRGSRPRSRNGARTTAPRPRGGGAPAAARLLGGIGLRGPGCAPPSRRRADPVVRREPHRSKPTGFYSWSRSSRASSARIGSCRMRPTSASPRVRGFAPRRRPWRPTRDGGRVPSPRHPRRDAHESPRGQVAPRRAFEPEGPRGRAAGQPVPRRRSDPQALRPAFDPRWPRVHGRLRGSHPKRDDRPEPGPRFRLRTSGRPGR